MNRNLLWCLLISISIICPTSCRTQNGQAKTSDAEENQILLVDGKLDSLLNDSLLMFFEELEENLERIHIGELQLQGRTKRHVRLNVDRSVIALINNRLPEQWEIHSIEENVKVENLKSETTTVFYKIKVTRRTEFETSAASLFLEYYVESKIDAKSHMWNQSYSTYGVSGLAGNRIDFRGVHAIYE